MGSELHIYLKELNLLPFEYQNNKLLSKGFSDEVILQDLRIGDQEVYPNVKGTDGLTKHKACCILGLKPSSKGNG